MATITENGAPLSATQFGKRLKAVLKQDPVMSGSGHLYLHHSLPHPLPDRALVSVQAHALEALQAQGIEGFDEEKTRARIAMILLTIAKPGRGKAQAQPKPKPEQRKQKQKRQRQPERVAYQRPHRPAPVIQVVIKKARTFHYPLDLPVPDQSQGGNGTGEKP